MLRFQMTLIALLIVCVALSSCDELVEILTPLEPDMPDADTQASLSNDDTLADMPDADMLAGLPMYIAMYRSWSTHVTYPEPVGTGGVHGEGARTVYINDVGAMALEAENLTAYPAGSIIVKEIMDDANTFVQKVATMKKTDDSRHNGWIYKKYARPDAETGYMQVKGDGLPDAAEGCHGCHAQAPIDSVFVDFSMPDTTVEAGVIEDADMP